MCIFLCELVVQIPWVSHSETSFHPKNRNFWVLSISSGHRHPNMLDRLGSKMLSLTTKGDQVGCQTCQSVYSRLLNFDKINPILATYRWYHTRQFIQSWKEIAWDHEHLLLILRCFRQKLWLFTLFNALLNLDKLSVGNKSMWKVSLYFITCDGMKENSNTLGKSIAVF